MRASLHTSASLIAFLLSIAGRAGAQTASNGSPSDANQIKVCVDVQLKSWRDPGVAPAIAAPPSAPVAASAAPSAPAEGSAAPSAAEAAKASRVAAAAAADNQAVVIPPRYLKRMVEYEVTHEDGFEAVSTGCRETLTIEMYPLSDGWTVFGRYTGTSREEKIDQVQYDELMPLAQRLTTALLHDVSISETVNRQNVLRADSESRMRMIDGRSYYTLALGTTLRAASLPTADGTTAAAQDQWRLVTPLDLQIGYRGKFQAWGLDAFVRGMLGMNERAVRRNETGGHADYSKGISAGLHFLRYFTPEGMNSLYAGGGASFELSSYNIIKPKDDRYGDDRDGLLTGGLNADIILGYEFMRASAVHFFGQVDVQLPTYRIDTESAYGGIHTYAPGAVMQIGLVF